MSNKEHEAESIKQGFGLRTGLRFAEEVSLAAEERGDEEIARNYAGVAAILAAELDKKEVMD